MVGTGTFQAQTNVSTGSAPTSVTKGDLNGDGMLDVITADINSDTASICLAKTVQGSIGLTIQGRGALLDFSLDTKSNSLQALGMLRQTLDSINS